MHRFLDLWHKLRRSDNFYSLAGNLVYAGFSMLTFLLMVRLLDKELYGRWVIYVTATALLDMLRLGLTGTAAIRMISTNDGLERDRSIAASYHLSVLTTTGLSVLFLPVYFLLGPEWQASYYGPVLLFYPLLAFANLPFHQATMICQGAINFQRLFVIRGLNGFLIFLGISGYILAVPNPSLIHIIGIHVGMNALSSLLAFAKNWDGHQTWRHWNAGMLRRILQFGWYSTASYVGSNLLRSSDTVIMSLSAAMGAQAIAIYAIPLKLVELIEIPLRSFTATAFPKLSRAFQESRESFNRMLSEQLVGTSILLVPILIVLLLFADPLLTLIGGAEYADSRDLQRTLVYIITVYILLLPFDRYSGVALFALDKPQLNFWKIWLMLGANVVLDCVAVFVFASLPMVAWATILFTGLGILVGWWYIFRETAFPVGLLWESAGSMSKQVKGLLQRETVSGEG
jgi:O-antigen/teichoic acid export membrane protein